MRVAIDTSRCQSYGNCVLSAPDVFDLDDDAGFAVILQDHPGEELHPGVREAVRSCPVEALSLHDD